MVLRADCLVNPLWIVDITYVKMIDGVYMWQLYVDWIMDVVGDSIYDGELLPIAYILNVGDGVVIFLCEHMHL